MKVSHPPLMRSVIVTETRDSADNSTESLRSTRSNNAGLVLRTQAPLRMIAAAIMAAAQLLIAYKLGGQFTLVQVLPGATIVVAAYIAGVVTTHFPLWRHPHASDERITAVIAIDIAFIYLLIATTSASAQFGRGLIEMLVVVHVAKHFFGGRQGWHAVQLGVVGYLGVLYYGASNGQAIDVTNELWTLALCTIGTALIIRQESGARKRLHRLVTLFENVEDGDFTESYDVSADRHPDEITRVGQAYNRVRVQLSSMVLTDPLTGCLNRRGLDQALAREVARATRTGDCFALIALDLDHFKQVNDTHGHLAGDALLREVGAILLAAGRAGDVVARMGGEEFAILLPGSGTHGANNFAARLCDRIRNYDFLVATKGPPVTLTTSIGVAVGSPHGEPNFAALLWSRADAALYAAKRAGRDCARAWMNETELSGEHAVIGTIGRRRARV